MISQGEAVRKIQGMVMGNADTISEAEIALAMIDIDKIKEGLSDEKAAKCQALYDEYMAKDEQLPMEADAVVDKSEAIKDSFEAILKVIDTDAELFDAMLDSVQEFLFNPPFEGYDALPYGLVEVGVFALLDYYLSKQVDYDQAAYQLKYRNSVADRSSDSNADYHMEHNYAKLQETIDSALKAADNDEDLKLGIACILTLTNIKTPEMLDMVAMGAAPMAKEIVGSIKSETLAEGENDMADNVYRLYVYIKQATEQLVIGEIE